MRIHIRRLLPALLLAVLAFSTVWAKDDKPAPAPAVPDTVAMTRIMRSAMVNVRVTTQGYDTTEPWKKRFVRTNRLRGVLVSPHTVLVPSGAVQDHLTIEVTVANSARRYSAKLKHDDDDIGLALIEITDKGLRETLKPVELGTAVKLDDTFDIYQLGQDNMVERYTGTVARANAYSTRLTLRCKTTLSDSGNGQPCMKDGKLVGLVVSTTRSRQEATVVSLETLRHYLRDFEDGTYDGLPGNGPWTYGLLRDDLRAYYGLSEDQHGVVITRTAKGRTGHDVLEPGDVILELDGQDIDDEGKYMDPTHGRLNMWFLMRGNRYRGEKIGATILRNGKTQVVDLQLQQRPKQTEFVPERESGSRPQFMVLGGMVILELSTDSSIGRGAGGVIIRRMRDYADWDPPKKRRRIVYVDHVLRDPANQGYENVYQQAIRSLNGVEILEIADVAKALETPTKTDAGSFHVFRFEGVTADVVLPADNFDEINKRIAEKYKVSKLRYLDGDDD